MVPFHETVKYHNDTGYPACAARPGPDSQPASPPHARSQSPSHGAQPAPPIPSLSESHPLPEPISQSFTHPIPLVLSESRSESLTFRAR
jgi:hypothetical protein